MKPKAKLIKVLGVRLKNRRVQGGLLSDGSVTWLFKRLVDREVVINRMRLSAEAIEAMFTIYSEFIKIKVKNEAKRKNSSSL